MRKMNKRIGFLALLTALTSSAAQASDVEIVAVDVAKGAPGSYHFQVTLKHADTGWGHYADRWQVVDEKGAVYDTRTLHHPHVNEQPFRRGLSGVSIPAGVSSVWIQAGCNQTGISQQRYRVELPK